MYNCQKSHYKEVNRKDKVHSKEHKEMTTAQAATNSNNLDMKENISTVEEVAGSTTRLVTKQDGSKVPFSSATLRQSLEQ